MVKIRHYSAGCAAFCQPVRPLVRPSGRHFSAVRGDDHLLSSEKLLEDVGVTFEETWAPRRWRWWSGAGPWTTGRKLCGARRCCPWTRSAASVSSRGPQLRKSRPSSSPSMAPTVWNRPLSRCTTRLLILSWRWEETCVVVVVVVSILASLYYIDELSNTKIFRATFRLTARKVQIPVLK